MIKVLIQSLTIAAESKGTKSIYLCCSNLLAMYNHWPILLAFIIHPLSTILYNDCLALWQVLLCLEILEIRYHRLYRDEFSINFTSSFPVEIQLFPTISVDIRRFKSLS